MVDCYIYCIPYHNEHGFDFDFSVYAALELERVEECMELVFSGNPQESDQSP